MKSESIEALLIDRELGELSPEAVELLEAWLSEHSEFFAEVSAVRDTLEVTRAAVRRFPDLARPDTEVGAFARPRFRLVPLAWAAAVVIMLGSSGWLGFRAGHESALRSAGVQPQVPAAAAVAKAANNTGPWARYALASDPRGGLTVVRRHFNPQP